MAQTKNNRILLAVVLLLLLVVILRTAWISDDAYISFRTVDNLVSGHGLTWNIAERVQAFTNPLWVILLSPFYALTGDIYFTSIFLSVFLTILAAIFMARCYKGEPNSALLGLTILISSKAFIDYATSGLENALGYAILGAFLFLYLTRKRSTELLFILAILASLGALNRLDTIVLYLPVLGLMVWYLPKKQGLKALAIGFAPLILWELFSLWYYGFPFPNTYYAKLHTGIPAYDLFRQGFVYYLDSLTFDPLTLSVICGGLLLTLKRENKQ
ncbi:MAG: hypothetical protein V3T31_01385, partial [candidate division Zixibacteria bacterium]